MEFKPKDEVSRRPYQECLDMINDLIGSIYQNLKKGGTAADLTKLFNLKVEFQQIVDKDDVKEIEITWVDPKSLES
jgi:hypothetical protein